MELGAQDIPRSQKYYSLQPGGDLESAFGLRRRSHAGDEVDRLSARLQASGVSPRSSSRSLVMRRLNTIQEQGGSGKNVVDEGASGGPSGSSLRGRKAPVPAPRRRSSDREDDSELPEGGEEALSPPELPPPPGWVPEDGDPRENEAGNPLLRHSSQTSGGSARL